MGCYFQVGKSLKLGMPITTGFRTALNTWASWVETVVNTNRTSIFFRTFESSHWSGRNRNSCKVTQHPWSGSWGKDRSAISDIIIEIVRKMKVPVTILHVTPMVSFRSDGHVGTWSNNPSVPDFSHWCLPGVPDMWNEILLNLLPMNQATKTSVGVDVCMTFEGRFYKNLPEVQKALHANRTNLPYPWSMCSRILNNRDTDGSIKILPLLTRIVQNRIPVWVFRNWI